MRADRSGRAGKMLLIVAACAAAGCQAVLGPSRQDANWHALDGARVSLFFRPGSFAESIAPSLADVVNDQYAHTAAVLGLQYGSHVSVYLYNSASDAQLDSERSGTAYPLTESAKAVCVPPFDDNLLVLVSHEVNHVVIEGGLGRPGTYFANEGLASAALSERYHSLGRPFLYTWTREHQSSLPRITDLMNDSKWNGVGQQVAYNASASFLAFLLERYGNQGIRRIYNASSSEIAVRFAEAYGRPIESLEHEWLQFVESWTR